MTSSERHISRHLIYVQIGVMMIFHVRPFPDTFSKLFQMLFDPSPPKMV